MDYQEFIKRFSWYDNAIETIESFKKYQLVAEKQADSILAMIPVLEEFYPERWCIKMDYNKDRYLRGSKGIDIYPVIYFPEITVRNSRDQSIIIYDMFVSLKLGQRKYMQINNISGLRTTFTIGQYSTQYTHSHISRNTGMEFINFCLGSGEMYNVLMMIEDSRSTDMIRLMFYQLNLYLQWESLEGGPHIKMEVVNKLNRNGGCKVMNLSNLMLYSDTMISRGLKFDVKYKSGKLNVTINRESEIEVLKTMASSTNVQCVKDIDGKFYPIIVDGLSYMVKSDNEKFYFRDKVFSKKLIDLPDENKLNMNNVYFNPQLTEYVTERAREKAQYAEIKLDCIRRLKGASHI